MRGLARFTCTLFALLDFLSSAPAQQTKIEVVPSLGAYTSHPVAPTPDGRFAAIAAGNGAELWDIDRGRLVRSFTGLNGLADAVDVSADGKQIAAAKGKKIQIWDLSTGQVNASLNVELERVRGIAFSRDGRRLAYAGLPDQKLWANRPEPIIYIRDIASGRVIQRYSEDIVGHGLTLGAQIVAVSSDRSRIAVGDADGLIHLVDFEGRPKRSFPGHKGCGQKLCNIRSLAFSPDGGLLASGSYDAAVKIWDVASGALVRSLPIQEAARVLSFSADGRRLAVGDGTSILRLWNLQTGEGGPAFQHASASVEGAVHLPDGKSLLLAGSGFRLVDAQTLQLKRTISGAVLPASLVPNPRSYGSEVIASDDDPPSLFLINLTEPGVRREVYGTEGQRWWDVGGARDGLRIFARGEDAVIAVDRSRPGLAKVLPGDYRELVVSPDGAIGLVREKSGSAVFNTQSGEIRWRLPKDAEGYHGADFSADDRFLITGDFGSLKIWDTATGRVRASAKVENMNGLKFLPDGKSFLILGTSFKGYVVEHRSLDGARLLRKMERPGAGTLVDVAAVNETGSLAIISGHDGVLRLWNLGNGSLVREYRGHTHPVDNVAFAMDGRRIVSRSSDGIRVWNTDTGELLVTYLIVNEVDWLAITPEGFFAASGDGAQALSIVQGLEVYSIDQLYQALYRPDLVREKLAGDPRGLVRAAAAKLDLNKVLASGKAPSVTLASPRDGMQATGEQVTGEVEISEKGGGVGRVEWRINGVTVGIETPPVPPAGQPLRLSRRLVLDDGENEIEVVAYNSANLVASVPARATVAVQAATAGTPARMFVLAVGLNKYAEAKFELTYAVPDAKALAQALSESGKGVYESVDVTLVQDADVKRGKLDAVFVELASKVRPSDVLVFFLGGHGKTIDSRYYFVPQDFRVDGPMTSAGLDAAVVKQGIAQEEWQAWLARIPARKSILLFDTCESGSLTGEGKETHALERGAANDRLVQATGRTILTASSDDADAIEGFRGHGLFTYNVLEALERADTDGNGRIEVAELAAYVYAQVTALSEQIYRQRQVPQMRITGNYSLVKPTQIFAGMDPGIVLPAEATHQVTSAVELLVLPAAGARRVRKLDAKTPVTLVKSDAGWTLVAREGRPLGFVATKDLTPIQ
jgi:WD40 repeat protein/uncharacterized caspase-like protein